ncbi:MAG: hypothetical protein K5852_09820 [Eubacterium sp.]|nr:hypothetical protein [Eubacterium sp.]
MAADQGWYRLDNAAKIIPSSVEGADTRVMRLTCELKEEVDPALLQEALDLAMPEFPHLNCCLRRGVFWYYLDNWRGTPEIMEETIPALSSLYTPGHRDLLFRVMYYGKRINLEMFHVLADGTGGFVFLVHILTHYLSEKYGLDYGELAQDLSSVTEKEEDAFSQFYEGRKLRKINNRKPVRKNFIKEMFPVKAYQIKGHMDEDLRQHLIEGTVPTGKLLEVAHGYEVTVGVLIVSLYVEAMMTQITARERRRPIVVSVPVNLRQFFPSATTRNFYGAIQIRFDPAAYQGTLESILTEIQKGFMENLTEENMFNTMNGYAALEHNYAIKMTPLVLKYWGIRGYNNLVKQGVTTSVSNIGKVELPEAMRQYVSKFAAFMASRTAFLCLTSFGDKTVFGITSCFTEHTVFMHFFRRLTRLGIPVELTTNDYDREGV